MAFDPGDYEREVLKPARMTGEVPSDLFVRYGFLDEPPAEDDDFDRQVRAVVSLWTSLLGAPGWAVVDSMYEAHKKLSHEGGLNRRHFAERNAAAREIVAAKLADLVTREDLTHVGPIKLAELGRRSGAATDSQVRELLPGRVVVVDPLPGLPPAEPAPPAYADLRQPLSVLGKRLSVEVIFEAEPMRGFLVIDGFRLRNGRGLDEDSIRAAAKDAAENAQDLVQTATDTVIAVIRRVYGAGQADQLVFWEVLRPLRDLLAATPTISQRGLTDEAMLAGLDPDQAGRLAVALIEGQAAGPAPVAPPAPVRLTAVIAGGHVNLSWPPVGPCAFPVIYHVIRGFGDVPSRPGEGTVVAAATGGRQAVDENPPIGERLSYAVFAGREVPGQAELLWSGPAIASGLTVAPGVADVTLAAGLAGSVTLRWTAPAQAALVEIERLTEDGPIPVASVGQDVTSLVDSGLTPGTEVSYRLAAIYRGGDGLDLNSAWTAASTVLPPDPVTSLRVASGSTLTEVSWVPPPAGQVELYLGPISSWRPPGTTLTAADLASLGEAVVAPSPVPAGDRMSLALRPPPGRNLLLAVTRVGPWLVAGTAAELGRPAPVSALTARRLIARPGGQDQAELSWIWPDRAVSCRITWPDGNCLGDHICGQGECRYSRRRYADNGGLTFLVGPEKMEVTVSAVHCGILREEVSEPVSVIVPAGRVKVSYRWRPDRIARLKRSGPRRGHRRWVLELIADRACELTEILVVRSDLGARFRPVEPAQATTVVSFRSIALVPGQSRQLEVDLSESERGILTCLLPAAADDGPVLFPPAGPVPRR